jgi:hypothetical protein
LEEITEHSGLDLLVCLRRQVDFFGDDDTAELIHVAEVAQERSRSWSASRSRMDVQIVPKCRRSHSRQFGDCAIFLDEKPEWMRGGGAHELLR